VLIKRNQAQSSSAGAEKAGAEAEQAFAVQTTPIEEMKGKMSDWFREQIPLAEALAVAVTFHVLGFPLMWFIGWALPWPGSPVIITVIEINLENWPKEAKTEKVTDIYKSKMHKYDK
jgi:hypothetical protein